MHYQGVIERPRYEDFELSYWDKNPWYVHMEVDWRARSILNKAGRISGWDGP